jgi:hypothetical protein
MTTLEERWNNIKHFLPGHVESIMIDDLVKEVDILSDKIEKLKGPTYGPMLEDEEDDTLTWNHEAPKLIGKVLKTEMTNDGVEITVRPSTKEDE